jgi:hypothetical protein
MEKISNAVFISIKIKRFAVLFKLFEVDVEEFFACEISRMTRRQGKR